MRLDVHVTTCHRPEVTCRSRPHEGNNWNVREWTHEERLEISKISVSSIIKFCNLLESHGHSVTITLLDDGSSLPKAIEWINSLDIQVKRFSAKGSSNGINLHMQEVKKDPPDYILHLEDDNLLFNPLNLDWLSIVDEVKKANDEIKVFTFRSGLPVEESDKGFRGLWGPIKASTIANIHVLFFSRMGNAHHVMAWKDYIDFLPLQGNTGGCESYMNSKLSQLGLNVEPQIHVHCFHSHMYKFPIDNNNLNFWHKTGEGFEYGMLDMNTWLSNKKQVVSKIYQNFPDVENLELINYDF